MSRITEWVGAPGGFVVDLIDGTPQEILDGFAEWDHIVVVDQRVDPDQFTDADLKSLSRFSGVLLGLPSADPSKDRQIRGNGLAVHLGDRDGVGDVYETAVDNTDETFANWITDLLPAGGSIIAGTTHTVAGTLTASILNLTPRAALDWLTKQFGVIADDTIEWRVNPDGTLDAGKASDLNIADPENQTTPAVLVRNPDGPAGAAVVEVPVGALAGGKQARDLVLRQLVLAAGENPDTVTVGTADKAGHGLTDFHGNPLIRTRITSQASTSELNAATRAQALLDDDSAVRERWSLNTAGYHIQGEFVLGDWVLLYDPTHGFTDPTIEVPYAGEKLSPAKIRVVGLEWNLTPAMGIYHRASDGTWTDLTDWAVTTQPDTRIHLGDKPPTPTTNITSELSAARYEPDTAVPAAPTVLTVPDGIYTDTRGADHAYIAPSWTNPTLNTDGSTLLDLNHLELRWRIDGTADDWDTRTLNPNDTDQRITGLDLTTSYETQLRAVRRNGLRSAWTAPVVATTDEDTTAPGTPPTPSLASSVGLVEITIDLTGWGGTNIDTEYVQVFAGTAPNPTTLTYLLDVTYQQLANEETRTHLLAVAPSVYGNSFYVRLKAIDHAGNVSNYSAQASITVDPIDTDEIGDDTITAAKINVTTLSAITADLGSITAGSISGLTGDIGGWDLLAERIQSDSATVGMSSTVTGGDDIRFWAGDVIGGSPKFKVTKGGILTAVDAIITGTIITAVSVTASGNVSPAIDNSYDLGDASESWRNLYLYGLYDEAGVLRWDLSGSMTVAGSITMNNNGQLLITRDGEPLRFIQNIAGDDQFLTWYTAGSAARRGYFGYGSAGNDTITLENETGGNLALLPNGGGNVGINDGSPVYRFDVGGDIGLTDGAYSRYVAQASRWGYSAGYRVLILGSASTSYTTNITGSVTLSMGYDPSGNTSGAFSGDGREILFRNGVVFQTPNAADTAWHPTLYMKDGYIGAGMSLPTANVHVRGTTDTFITKTDDATVTAGEYIGTPVGGAGLGAYYGTVSNHKLYLGVNSANQYMVMDTSGQIGLGGQPTPTQLLDMGNTPRTDQTLAHFRNTTGNFYVGVDSSTGAAISGTAYASVVWNAGATDLILGTSNAARVTIAAAGAIGMGGAPGVNNRLTLVRSSDQLRLDDGSLPYIIGVDNALLKFKNSAGDTHLTIGWSSGDLQTADYASQTTGWQASQAGAADFRRLYSDEIHTKAFITDLEQALAGGQIVTKSVALVATSFALPAAAASVSITVLDMPSMPDVAVFATSDVVSFRQFTRTDADTLTVGWAHGTVATYVNNADGTQSWTWTRLASPNEGTATGTIAADSLALDFGVSGAGYYEVNAFDGANQANAPYSQVATWTTRPDNATVRARFGQLQGVTSVDEFGLFAGTNFGASDPHYFIASDAKGLEIHGGSITLYNSATTKRLMLDPDAGGDNPYLAIGATLTTPAYDDASTIFLGMDSSVPKMSMWNAGKTEGLTFNGSTFSVTGTVTVSGLIQTAAAGKRITIPSSPGDSIYFYSGAVGEETPGSLSIDSDGLLLYGPSWSPTITVGAVLRFQDNIVELTTTDFATNDKYSLKMTDSNLYIGEGDASMGWGTHIYMNQAAMNVFVGTSGAFAVDADVRPYGDLGNDLGTTSYAWADLYVQEIYDESNVLRWDTSGQLTPVVGSAAAPSHSFAGDLGSGLYRSSANRIGLAVGGVRRFDVGLTAIFAGEPGWAGWFYIAAQEDGGAADAGARLVWRGASGTVSYTDWYAAVFEDDLTFGNDTGGWIKMMEAQGVVELSQGRLRLKETTQPTPVSGYADIYSKSDNKLYCTTGDGVEHELAFV